MARRKVPKEIKDSEVKRVQELKRQFGRVPNGQGQFEYQGVRYKVKPNYADPSGYQIKSVEADQAADSTRRGVRLTLDDYINHPRYKGAPDLARQMYEFDQNMLKAQSRYNSSAHHLDHIYPVKGPQDSFEHPRNKLLLGRDDNIRKSNRIPSQNALDYLQIGSTKSEMIDLAASSPYPRQTPRDKRLILQGDLDIDFTAGMGRKTTANIQRANELIKKSQENGDDKNGENGKPNGKPNSKLNGKPNGKSNGAAAARLSRNLLVGPLSISAGLLATGQQAQATIANPTADNITNLVFDVSNSVTDLAGLFPPLAAPSEAVQRGISLGQMGYNAQRGINKIPR